MSAFTRTLLDSLPVIPGLDQSIVIQPRRLHITLGVMSLTDSSEEPSLSSFPSTEPPNSVSTALALLVSLKPRIQGLLAGAPLRVALRHADIMKPDHGDLARAHVLWVGPPSEGEDATRLRRVAGQSFLLLAHS
jgi:activating signal cointegrator complex subunit 1